MSCASHCCAPVTHEHHVQPSGCHLVAVLSKSTALDPRFCQVEILSESVGLRPARPAVRLEAERIGDGSVIHNYGHSGAGFMLSWGCAEEVLNLATR